MDLENINLEEVNMLLEIRDENGKLIEERLLHNTITNVGHAAANGRISNQGGYSAFTALAIGIGTETGSTATALNSEITTNGGGRTVADTIAQATTSVTNDTTSLTKTWTFTGSFAITEAGILDNASSGGNLLAYQTFSAVNVVSGNILKIIWTYQT